MVSGWGIAARLALAVILGAAIGAERELRDKAAGVTTHALLSLGAALFALVSVDAFGGGTDPARVAAQIVTGVGFLGAGAIIRSGTSVRGLTTAASLWATASVGLAVGAAQYVIGVVGTAIIVLSLGPLRRLVRSLAPRNDRDLRVRVELTRLETLGDLSEQVRAAGADIAGLQSRRAAAGHYEIELQLRTPDRVDRHALTATLGALPEVTLIASGREPDPAG